MEYRTEKWGGGPHYRRQVHRLGEDEHGTWIWGPAGCTVWRGDEPAFTTDSDALLLAVPDAWWSPGWWVDHAEVDVYVNIGTPFVVGDDQLTSIDLDLDVIRFNDGHVELVDRDEFDVHQRELGYPVEVIDQVERAAALALDLVAAGAPPFDDRAARRWIDLARSADLPRLD